MNEMTKINTVYIIGHTHTDIGYTDHQPTLFRRHADYLDRAVELCEATADYPAEAQFKWTCELASTVENFLRTRKPAQIDRFLKLHHEGRIAVNAMAFHWTPMLSPAAMVRSLYTARRLRHEYGMNVASAMQCDVDGVSWLWADLLPAMGIQGLTMSINTYRGARPRPELIPFWWEGPGGRRLLTFNGPHYAYGLFFYGLGSVEQAERLLPGVIQRLEARDDYPLDFLYGQVTHPALVDNGPPYAVLSHIVREWNASGRSPRLVFTTIDGFLSMLNERYANSGGETQGGGTQGGETPPLPVWRGDWADWWADGVGSSAYETAIARNTEALLPAVDLLATQAGDLDPALIEEAYRHLSLYDEHTWGSFNSIGQPYSPLTKAQWNAKAGFAYDGFGLTHELLTQGGRRLARKLTGRAPEGETWRAWTQGQAEAVAADERDRFIVINPLSWSRRFVCPVPPDGGGRAPDNILDAFWIDNYRDSYPRDISGDNPKPFKPEETPLVDMTLPAFGYQVVAPTLPALAGDARAGEGVIANRWYHVEIDPATGGLTSWFDKELGRELAGRGPWRFGQYVYELTAGSEGRRALFAGDFTQEWFGTPRRDTPFRRYGPDQVTVGPAHVDGIGVSVEVFVQAPGARSLRVRYSLPHHEKALHIDMVIDKEHVTDPESIYIMFPTALHEPTFHLDLNGVPLTPEAEQLPGSCRDWYGIQRWAEVSDDQASIVLAPIDAPLVQVGGIQTGRWLDHLDAQNATLVSWPVNNYWTTNFQAAQNGELLFRYRLTSRPAYDPAAASRFAAEQLVPPVIVRVPGAEAGRSGQFLRVEPEGVADVQIKPAADGRGLIVHAFNLTPEAQSLSLTFPSAQPTAAWVCSPIEEDGEALSLSPEGMRLQVSPRSHACARVVFIA